MRISRSDIGAIAFYAGMAGAAFWLRMYGIGGQPVWTDEVTTIEPIRRLALGEFVNLQAAIDPSPPLYHLLAFAWGRLGSSVEWIRTLSAAFGAITVPALYSLARQGLGRPASFLAAALLAFTPLHVHLSQQARYPAFLCLAAVLSSLYFVRFCEAGSRVDRHRYILSTAAMLYTHAFALLVVAVQALVALTHRARIRDAKGLWLAWGIAAILFAPWIPQALHQAGRYGGGALFPMPIVLTLTPVYLTTGYTDWHPPLKLPLMIKDLLGLDKFDIGVHLAILAASLVPFIVLWAVGIARRDGRGIGHGFVRLGMALGLGIYFSAIFIVKIAAQAGWILRPASLFKPYYMIALVPLSVLLLASGTEALCRWRRGAATAALALTLAPMSIGLAEYERPYILKEDWPAAAEVIARLARPGDAVLVPNRIQELCLGLYFAVHIPLRAVTAFDPLPDGSEAVSMTSTAVDRAFGEFVSGHDRIWVIGVYPGLTDPEGAMSDAAASRLYEIDFGGFKGDDPQAEPRFSLRLYATRPEALWREFSSSVDFEKGDFQPLQLGPGWCRGGGPWRWMGSASKTLLRRPDGARGVRADFFADTSVFKGEPLNISIAVDGRVVGRLRVERPGIYNIEAGLPVVPDYSRVLEVELACDRTFVPDRVFKDGDLEPKSISVGRIELR